MIKDWSDKEKKQITDLLKKVPAADRPAIRDAVKDMKASEALALVSDKIQGMSGKPSASLNKPLKASEGINTPIQSDKSQNKPVKVSESGERLERVQGDIIGSDFNIDTIRQDIQAFIRSWCDNNNIDDLRKAEQPIYNAICTDIGNTIFKPSAILKDHNQYDISKVISIIDIYDYFCNMYNKVFTIWGAAAFCGVSKDFMYDNMEKLTRSGCDLHKNNERSLADSIVSGRRSPVGALSWLNRYHGWSFGTFGSMSFPYPVLVDINKSGRETISDKQSQ